MIYVNGDSHTAGAELVKDYCFAEDDPLYKADGRSPHPQAVPLTFAYQLAQALELPLYLDAESASSNDRILRTTEKYLSDNTPDLVVIGWTTWEREEWNINGEYYQLTASGTDSVPQNTVEAYKQWVVAQDQQELRRKRTLWIKKINDFAKQLEEKNIPYLFFTTEEYSQYLTRAGYKTVNNGYHFGKDAHVCWFKYLLDIYHKRYYTV